MTDLLTAAKAVIEMWDRSPPVWYCQRMVALRAAVERAEKQDGVDAIIDIGEEKEITRVLAMKIAFAAQQAERERIRARVKIAAEKTWKAGDWFVGPQHFMLDQFVDALLENDDE